VEAAELLPVEVGVFGEGHHGSLDLDRLAAAEIANERSGQIVGHADAADAGVDADVEWNGFLGFGGDLIERWAQRRVDHGHDGAGNSVFEVLFVERAKEEDGLANAGIAKRDGFVELYDGEAEDFRLRFEELGDVCDAHAVAVVFDDGEDGTRSGAAGNFLDVVAQIFTMNFHPGIEG